MHTLSLTVFFPTVTVETCELTHHPHSFLISSSRQGQTDDRTHAVSHLALFRGCARIDRPDG